MISVKEFSQRFLGFRVSDCEVRNREFFYFIAREDYTQWTDWEEQGSYPAEESLLKRVISIKRSTDSSQWGNATLQGYSRLMAGVAWSPKEQLIVGSLDGKIYIVGGGEIGAQDSIGERLPGALCRFSTIQDELYLAGSGRCAAKRTGKNQWKWLSHDIPYDRSRERTTAGFRAIDGFSSQDIYAAGGEGDVWHYNGSAWRRVDFPSNVFLETVCCGGDGRVYISGYEGHTFVGQGDTWKKVSTREDISLAFQDMVWYEDRVWCTNDYGVWWIVGDQLMKADIPAFARISAGHLSTRDGVLLLAGFYGAAFIENGQWHKIFNYGEMVDRCKAEGLYDGVLQARWHEFKD